MLAAVTTSPKRGAGTHNIVVGSTTIPIVAHAQKENEHVERHKKLSLELHGRLPLKKKCVSLFNSYI
jgi:hypothetical protein